MVRRGDLSIKIRTRNILGINELSESSRIRALEVGEVQ